MTRSLLTALMSYKPSKPGSSSNDGKPAPSDLGDLVAAAMENLRISLSGDERTVDEQIADFICTVHAHRAKSSHSDSPSHPTPSPFATASRSTVTPMFGEMSAFYDLPHKDAPLPSAIISEEYTNPSPFTQQESSSPSTQTDSSSPSLFLPSSYRDPSTPSSMDFAPTLKSSAPLESLSVRGPDGLMDFAMSCGDTLFETLVECMQHGDGTTAALQPQPDTAQHGQSRIVAGGDADGTEVDFSSWLAKELQGEAPWAMSPARTPASPG